MKHFLKTNKTRIIGPAGRPVMLRGVNLGGWLMMEGYILYAPNIPEHRLKQAFAARLGKTALRVFETKFREHFIQKEDIRRIARLGFNCIRVPFNSRLVETRAYRYDRAGALFLDRVIRWAKECKMWVILDLHAAPGAQNHDWHGDSAGKAPLWTQKSFQDRTMALWEFLADRYKNESAVAGYDLLNEAVVRDSRRLNRFYKKLMTRLRAVDQNHILFIEGNHWATDLNCLDVYDDGNYALSCHYYEPFDFVFNFVSGLSYPFTASGQKWNRETLRRDLLRHKKTSVQRNVPILVGEFGVNARYGHFGEDRWLQDVLECFSDYGFHWTYWTYKAVKNGVLPDGIYSYAANPPWVNRLGPAKGWATYVRHWPARQKDMIRSWHTDQFCANEAILKVLKNAV